MRRLLSLTLFLAGLVAIAQAPADSAKPETRPAANPIPDSFTNLQELPKGISKRQLMGVMKGLNPVPKV